jgi:hypothetical protein
MSAAAGDKGSIHLVLRLQQRPRFFFAAPLLGHDSSSVPHVMASPGGRERARPAAPHHARAAAWASINAIRVVSGVPRDGVLRAAQGRTEATVLERSAQDCGNTAYTAVLAIFTQTLEIKEQTGDERGSQATGCLSRYIGP